MKTHLNLFKIFFSIGLLLGISVVSFSQDTVFLGSKTGLATSLKTIQAKKGRANKVNLYIFNLHGEENKIVLTKVIEEKGVTTFHGHDKKKESKKFFIVFDQEKVEGHFYDEEDKNAVSFKSQGDSVVAIKEDLHHIICTDYRYIPALKNEPVIQAKRLDDSGPVYELQSNPGAPATIYLDFDGEVVNNTNWNEGNRIDAASFNWSDAKMKSIWKEMSEDFMAFNVNVTTDRSVFNNTPKNRRMQTIFTPSQEWRGRPSGGVAYRGSFDNNNNDPCWVFNSGTRSAAMTGSHEVGHTLGLLHDGLKAVNGNEEITYYKGHGNWGTIMGSSTPKEVMHWSKGEYANANQTQNDIAIIAANNNGFGYRTDDHAGNTGEATLIEVENNGSINPEKNDGVIERRSDKDYFKFVTGAGQITLAINPASYSPDLNIQARLLDNSGGQVAVSNPESGLAASFSRNVTAGTYYLEIDGVGDKANPSVGYSDYSSLGYYSISGNLIADVPEDCNGVAGGSAILDDCNVCVLGNTGKYPCAAISNGTYTISNVHSNKCLFVNPIGRQKTCDSTNADEVWTITKQGNFYSFVNLGTGNALELPSIANLTNAEATSPFTNSNEQLFRIEQRTQTQIKIVPSTDLTKGIAISGLNTDENRELVVWDLIDDNNYRFILSPVLNATKDCNNKLNGTAFLDYCNECVGGSTGKEACQVPYATQLIPGEIELESYDYGGQNVSYFEKSLDNKGDFRVNDAVDIGLMTTGGYHLGWTAKDEWTEYTVDVLESGMYELEYVLASTKNTGFFHLEIDNVSITESVNVRSTGSWEVYETMAGEKGVELEAGTHILKFYVDEAGLNADKVLFRKQVVSSVDSEISNGIRVFPTPNETGIFNIEDESTWQVQTLQGELIANGNGRLINLSNEVNGVYLIKINGTIQKVVLNK